MCPSTQWIIFLLLHFIQAAALMTIINSDCMEAANISDIFDTNVLSPTHIQILTEFGSKWNIEEL